MVLFRLNEPVSPGRAMDFAINRHLKNHIGKKLSIERQDDLQRWFFAYKNNYNYV